VEILGTGAIAPVSPENHQFVRRASGKYKPPPRGGPAAPGDESSPMPFNSIAETLAVSQKAALI